MSTDLVAKQQPLLVLPNRKDMAGQRPQRRLQIRHRHGGSRDMEKDLESVHDLDGARITENIIGANAKISHQPPKRTHTS